MQNLAAVKNMVTIPENFVRGMENALGTSNQFSQDLLLL